jgi:hypothetical protein
MTNNYHIVLQDGVNQSDLYSLVTSVVDEIPFRSTYFIAECTDAQVQTLRDHDSVKFVNVPAPISSLEEDDDTLTKTVNYRRTKRFEQITGYSTTRAGNWGLLRHEGKASNSTTGNTIMNTTTDQTGTYTHPRHQDLQGNQTDLIGLDVDIILPIASILDPNDPEFITPGTSTSRLNTTYQWNQLPGMSLLPNIDYGTTNLAGARSASSSSIQHGEAVAYIAASNTYGWATGSDIYVFPRDQLTSAFLSIDPHLYLYDCARLFHEAKAGTANAGRPTVVISSFSKKLDTSEDARALMFRNKLYYTLAPGGGDEIPVYDIPFGYSGDSAGLAYGRKNLCPRSGYVDLQVVPQVEGGTYPMTIPLNFTSNVDLQSEILGYANDNTLNAEWAAYMEPVKDMTDAGVHHVVAAGNAGAKLCLPTNPDYNNAYIDPLTNTPDELHRMYFYNRPGWHVGPDTICVAALSASVDDWDGYDVPQQGAASLKLESLAAFSNRGDRIDTAAEGENIYLNLASLGTTQTYIASGTSFACPQVGGMLAQLLQAYPTATPAEMRQYFRDLMQPAASATAGFAYDSGISPVVSSKYGDLAYFGSGTGLMGFKGNIAIHKYAGNNFYDDIITPTAYASNYTLSQTPDSESLRNNQISFTAEEIDEKLKYLS